MEVSRLKISNSIQDKLIAHLTEFIPFKYKNILPEMAILATEEFYLRTNSEQLNLVVIKREGSYLYVDLVAGGGGTGLFSINWGSEKSFVRKTSNMIQEFCNVHGEYCEIVELD